MEIYFHFVAKKRPPAANRLPGPKYSACRRDFQQFFRAVYDIIGARRLKHAAVPEPHVTPAHFTPAFFAVSTSTSESPT